MQKLINARFTIFTIGLVISSICERFVTVFINRYAQLDSASGIYHLMSMLVLILLFLLTNLFLKLLVHTASVSKIVFGKSYIAGLWVEVITKEDSDEISHFTVAEIKYENDEIKVYGKCYENGKYAYKYDSICSKMYNYTLTFVFQALDTKGPRIDVTVCNFTTNTVEKIDAYNGRFGDHGMFFRIEAILVEEDSKKIKLNENLKEGMADIIPIINDKHGRNYTISDFFK